MLSITSCPNCETSFVVTERQLLAHDGKVRCSHCNHVFNATEWLYEIPDEPATEISYAPQQPTILADLALTRDKIPTPPALRKPASRHYPALIAILIIIATLQSTYALRTQIAGKWPQFKPFMADVCALFNCKVNLPQEADLLAIDDVELREDTEREGLIRLTSTLINNAKFTQAYPALELTLTDPNGKVQVRRVFAPREYLPAERKVANGIAAGEDVYINLAMTVTDIPVSGYRASILYK
ncbi:MAG: DUF3426 domain-containing protein [Methylophilaceae bacterium]|nr:DUF3426 domain-containing protein [Methylophilaceae bacterium]